MKTAFLGRFLKRRPPSRVVMETCAEAFHVAEAAQAAGHAPRVVPATLVRSLGVGSRGIKTDVRDARLQSELSCRMEHVPSVHIPARQTREWKTILNMRDALVTARTQLVNTVRGYLRTQVLSVRSTPKTFPQRVREYLKEKPLGLADCVERQLTAIETLNAQIAAADEEITRIAEANATCSLLMTVPGVGTITASRFVSAVETVGRFANAHALESYLGLTPGESSSSDRKHRTGLTKAGPSAVRKCLVQGCWAVLRLRPRDPLAVWGRAIADRRGKQVAVCAMSRKLAGILFAMWRDGRPYDPRNVCPEGQPA
jgi:transposase